MAQMGDKLYASCDYSTLLRSCEEEVAQPLEGELTGEIPSWLCGTLLRNGPGSLKVGSMKFKHLFDGAALLHRFAIGNGKVTYQCRFLRTNTFMKNRAANRIVVTEFGTKAVPDPCRTIFDRVAAVFNPSKILSDNALISLYPFGDEIYAFTEGPILHRVDPVTLGTLEKRNMTECVALVNHTAHPHVMRNGDVYNVGVSIVRGKIRHVVVKFPFTDKGDMFESSRIVASMRPRSRLRLSYMHSFGITDNYFVIVEQPLSISLQGIMKLLIKNEPIAKILEWFPERETHIVLLSRETGKEVKRFRTTTLFYLHIINCYEHNGSLVVDLCAYKDAKIIDGMYIHAIETMQSNADYANWFRARPKRLQVSLDAPDMTIIDQVTIADISCETPRIHYDLYNGRYYRYFYAISSDVDAQNPGAVIKVDTQTGDVKTWCEDNCYSSEPVFVPAPNATIEDDGVLLCAVIRSDDDRNVTLVILDAKTMKKIGHVQFITPSPAPKCLHGWYLPRNS